MQHTKGGENFMNSWTLKILLVYCTPEPGTKNSFLHHIPTLHEPRGELPTNRSSHQDYGAQILAQLTSFD